VIEQAIDGRIELIVPHHVVSELESVLRRKLEFDDERWEQTERLLAQLSPGRPRASHVAAVTGDPDDDEILAAAIEADADVLVTGDRTHLLPLGEHKGVRIVAPQALLAELL
jgi:predicted nucleic acid-binding protein